MQQILNSRFSRGVIAFLLTITALFSGVYGVLLFIEIFTGSGSPEGNAYLFTFALILLIFSPIGFAFATYYWKSAKLGSRKDYA